MYYVVFNLIITYITKLLDAVNSKFLYIKQIILFPKL